jgi:hypothetical protein
MGETDKFFQTLKIREKNYNQANNVRGQFKV